MTRSQRTQSRAEALGTKFAHREFAETERLVELDLEEVVSYTHFPQPTLSDFEDYFTD
ncbi:MAG: hypothetical protein L0387_41675 [Acidobacteria bacterium]|nr:hypothetical protein [Acidobacteriota bacterium]MCI0628099.1 hypothetical protein [Acidobacteriota bacterium]MCI0719773.1 hypothetical protein [Acidobacteriota bacterium]